MSKIKWIRIMMTALLILGLSVTAFGCFAGRSNENGENEANSDSKTGSETTTSDTASALSEIGKDQAFYNFYNKVQINQTKSDVGKSLGVEPTVDTDGSYIYLDPATGYAVNVFYSAGDIVTTKVLLAPTGGGDWMKLSNAAVTEDQVQSIQDGMTYNEVNEMLPGEGLEMAAMIYPGTKDKIAYLLVWINSDFSVINVTFDGDTGKVISAEYRLPPV